MLKRHFEVNAPLYVLLLMVAGSVFFISYLSSLSSGTPLSFGFLIAGVTLFSVSSALLCLTASEKHSKLLILAICILALTLLLRYAFRFQVLSGADNLDDFRASSTIYQLGFWPGNDLTKIPAYQTVQLYSGIHSFSSFSSFALVIPVFFAEITGIPLYLVYEYGVYFIGSLLPLFLFVMLRRFFSNSKIAIVSSLLFTQSFLFFTVIFHNVKEIFALIFLLMSLYAIFRGALAGKWERQTIIILLISEVGIVLSHYTITYFTIFLFLALMAGSFVAGSARLNALNKRLKYSRDLNSTVHKPIFFGFASMVLLTLGWLVFAVPWWLKTNLEVVKLAILRFGSMGFGFSRTLGQIGLQQGSVGVIVAYWQYLGFALIFAGILYGWFVEKKGALTFSWIFTGTLLILLVGFWAAFPSLSSVTFSYDRVFSISSLFLFSFVAKLFVSKKRAVIFLLIAFVFVSPFMNLAIPSNSGMVLYHPVSQIPVEDLVSQQYNTRQGLILSDWINTYVNHTRLISCDFFTSSDLASCKNPLTLPLKPAFVDDPIFHTKSYLLLSAYYQQYGLWTYFNPPTQSTGIYNNGTTANLMYTNNVIYENGEYTLIMEPESLAHSGP